MAKSHKYDKKNPTIRGASRKSEMDAKKRLHKRSGGRPARLKALLDADNKAELEALRKETDAKAKAKAEAKETAPAKKSKSKTSVKKGKTEKKE